MHSEKTCDIFIRTYHGDIQWLQYSLKSIHKYLKGFRDIVIVIPKNQASSLSPLDLSDVRVCFCDQYKNDYLGQQITKLNAYLYTDADFITFWDSDVIAHDPITPEDYIHNRKPILYKTPYSVIGDNGSHWKKVSEKALKQEISYEYMRRLPLTYCKDTFSNFHKKFEEIQGKSIEEYVLEIPDNDFSEFNVIGAYIDLFEADKYDIIDTCTVQLPLVKAKQYWSWGGLTPEIQSEIKGFLKE